MIGFANAISTEMKYWIAFIFVTMILALSSMVTRADWQWVEIGAVNNDVQDARAAIRVQDDCELF